MIGLARLFVWIAAAGFVASVIVHVATLAGLPQPFGPFAWGLHVGLFVVWIPTVLVAQRLSKGARQTDFWKAALRGAPPWMRRLLYALTAYAFVNLFVGIAFGPESEADGFRIFSGHWMFFYFAGMAILYSASQLGALGPRSCPRGHEVSPFARFCEECGAQLPPIPIA